jgi:signal transduction histidine kinase
LSSKPSEEAISGSGSHKVTDGDKLCLIYEEIEARHACSIETLMEAIQTSTIPFHLLYSFFATRISIQLLLLHHLNMWQHKGFVNSRSVVEHSGRQLINSVVLECTHLCEAHYDMSPPVEVFICSRSSEDNMSLSSDDVKFVHSASYIKYVLLELLKNAMRAVVDKHIGRDKGNGDDSDEELGNIHVKLSLVRRSDSLPGECNINIAVIDSGDGVSAEVIQSSLHKLGNSNGSDNNSNNIDGASEGKLWSRLDDQVSYMPARSPLHGIGIGLAMSQSYAQYLGGSLNIESGAGWGVNGGSGTTATLSFPRLDSTSPFEMFENIPQVLELES